MDNGPGTPIVSGVVMAGADLYRPRTLSDKSSPLPIALLEFDAECSCQGNIINWQTASETNNDYFELFRSDDGVTFHSVLVKPGNGNSSSINNYSCTDEPPAYNYTQYKLIQFDYNGVFNTVAKKQVVPSGNNGNITIHNGNLQEIGIDYKAVFDEQLEVAIYDITGRLNENFRQYCDIEGNNQIRLQHKEVAFGSYMVTVKSTNAIHSQQIILK